MHLLIQRKSPLGTVQFKITSWIQCYQNLHRRHVDVDQSVNKEFFQVAESLGSRREPSQPPPPFQLFPITPHWWWLIPRLYSCFTSGFHLVPSCQFSWPPLKQIPVVSFSCVIVWETNISVKHIAWPIKISRIVSHQHREMWLLNWNTGCIGHWASTFPHRSAVADPDQRTACSTWK